MKVWVTGLAAILALGSSGCGPKRKVLVLPATPQVAKPLPETTIVTPPEIETPVLRVELPLVELPPSPAIEHPDETKPVPPRKPVAAAPAVPPASTEPQPPNPIAPPAPTPRLGEIMTDQRRRQYEAEFNGSMARARAAVGRASGRRLTATQQETVGRIQTFVQQAEKLKVRDLMQALQLARRADLLGQDLVKSLR